MSSQLFRYDGFRLQEGVAKTEDGKRYYKGAFATGSMNTKAFHLSEDVRRQMAEQANDLPVFLNHNTYNSFPGGRSYKSYLENGNAISEFYMDDDESNKMVLDRMDSGTIRDLSLGGYGGDFYCDLCGEEMEAKADWFWVSYEDKNGHRLGRTYNIEGEKKLATAELRGEFHLKEFSVVGIGADPNAKLLEQLSADLSSGKVLMEDLPFIAESCNIRLSNFCTTLGVDLSNIPILGGPPPEPNRSIFDMGAISTDVKVLQDLNTDLQKSNTTLSAENAKLKEKVADFEKRVPVLEQQAQAGVNLKTEVEKSKVELETYKKKADSYDAYKASAVRQAMTNYRNWRGLSESQAADDMVYQMKQKELEAMESIESIVSVGSSYLGMTHDQNAGGRKSVDTPPGTVSNDTPFFSGMNNI